MIDWQALADWAGATVADLELAPQFVVGPETAKHQMPDGLGFITPTPGAGGEAEGLIRFPAFQVRIRTLAEYVPQALAVANRLDQVLMFGQYVGTEWGTIVASADHTGGEPVPLIEDDRHNRISVVCTYIVREVLRVAGSAQ